MILSFLWLLLTITAGGIYFYGNTEIVLPVLTLQLAFAVAVLGAAALAQPQGTPVHQPADDLFAQVQADRFDRRIGGVPRGPAQCGA